MSRGIHLGYPSSVSFPTYLRTFAYDSASYIWAVESDQPSIYEDLTRNCKLHYLSFFADYDSTGVMLDEKDWKIRLKGTVELPVPYDIYMPQNMVITHGKVYFSLNKALKRRDFASEELYNIAVKDSPDGYDSECFNSIGCFEISTGTFTTIDLPVEMKSNITVINDCLYFGKKVVEDDNNDSQVIYRYNVVTHAFSSCILTGVKKQRERLNTFSTFKNNKLFVPLWNDFKVAIVNTDTFTLSTTIPANGYPSTGIYTDESNSYFSSFAGMLTKLNVDNNTYVSELGTGGVGKNLRNSLAFEHGTTKVWFALNNTFGRIDTSNKEVISSKEIGKDYGILTSATADSANLQFQLKKAYSLPSYFTGSFKYDAELVSTPKFVRTYIDKFGAQHQMTIYSRIIVKTDKGLTMFNSRDVEFVFTYTEETESTFLPTYETSHMIVGGNAMVGSGDTDYIGEFFL